jgi:hypothetical protein
MDKAIEVVNKINEKGIRARLYIIGANKWKYHWKKPMNF